MLADVRFEAFDGGIIASVSGEVDMSNADEIGNALKQMLTNEALGLVLDLSQVDYFDSAGIHMIYDMRESLSMRGQKLQLVIPESTAPYDALRLAAVLQSLDVTTTVGEATAAIAVAG